MAGEGGRSRRGAKKSGPPAARNAAVRVRTARRRKPSSTEWLSRQLNDPYVAEAQRLGYRSRAAFKLIELDDRFRLLLPARRVVDLGCAPGGWTQVAVERVGARGAVVGVDLAGGRADCRCHDPVRRYPRPGRSVRHQGRARRFGRSCAERHGAAGDGPCRDRPSADRRARRGGIRCRRADPQAGRRVCRQGVPGRRRGRAPRAAEAGIRRIAPRKAAGEPRPVGGDLRRREGVSAAAGRKNRPEG